MASLRKKKGRYYARFYDPSRSPTRKERSLRTTRKDVAKPRLREWEKAYAEGRFDPWSGGWLIQHKKFSAAEAAFLNLKKQEGARPNTISAYEYALKGLAEHLPAGINVRDVAPDHIRPYVYESKKSNATKRHRHGHLNAFFNWCVDESIADSNPMEGVKKPRKEEKMPAFLQPKDIDKMFAAIDVHREERMGEPGPTPEDTWMKQIVTVAVCTGLRRGELLNLRWEDIDLDSSRLHVRNREGEGFKAKGGSERVIPLAGDAVEVLADMKARRSPSSADPVFIDSRGKKVRPDRVSRRFSFYVDLAKLPERLSFHSCRHTTGTWLAMKNVPTRVIQGILGHSQVSTTEVYTHMADGMAERAMEDTFGA